MTRLHPLGSTASPNLTKSMVEGAKEAVVAMDQCDSEWTPASAARRRCDSTVSSIGAVYAMRNYRFLNLSR